ncbi:hypothetical protein [Acinetobacter phage vB_ApiM_IME-Ap7]
MKYKVGDRVYWTYLGRKLRIKRVGFSGNVYVCSYDKPPYEVIGFFRPSEIKPIITCK